MNNEKSFVDRGLNFGQILKEDISTEITELQIIKIEICAPKSLYVFHEYGVTSSIIAY